MSMNNKRDGSRRLFCYLKIGSAEDLAHGGVVGRLGLIGVDVHGGSTAHIDTDESQAANNPTVGEIFR